MIAYASAMVKAIKEGKLSELNSMLDRLHGKPKESYEHSMSENLLDVFIKNLRQDESDTKE
jgi:hypothetical protein